MWVASLDLVNPDVLRILIDNGADVSIKDENGKRALDYAVANENFKGTNAYDLLREITLFKK